MKIIDYFKKKKAERIKALYEKQLQDLHQEAAKLITIRNVSFGEEGKVRPCILINDVIAYVSYEDDQTDIMQMMLHLRELYVALFKSMSPITLM